MLKIFVYQKKMKRQMFKQRTRHKIIKIMKHNIQKKLKQRVKANNNFKK